MGHRLFPLLMILVILLIPARVWAQEAVSGYPDSADGFRQQLKDLTATKMSGDEAGFRSKIDAFAIPDADGWIAAHFSPLDAPRLQRDYQRSVASFKENLANFIENAARIPLREIAVWQLEPPTPPNEILLERGLPTPTHPAGVACFTYGSPPEEKQVHVNPKSSFVYLEGKFRYVGSIFPFWWRQFEVGTVDAPELIHRVNPEYPKKARKQRIEGTVRMYAIIGKDGVPHDLMLVKGDPLLSEAAFKAVQQWRYRSGSLSGVPVELDVIVDVFFQLKH